MRSKFVALFLLLGGAGALLTNPVAALAQDFEMPLKPRMKTPIQDQQARGANSEVRLHTSANPADPDTVYIGHVGTTGPRPGIPGQQGGYGPFHIGRGPSATWSPTNPKGSSPWNASNPNRDGMWTWDNFQAGESDSLQGWWPLRNRYSFLVLPTPDDQRP